MGMSTSVIGFRPPDDDWRRMKAIWDACLVADVDPPELVAEFFNHCDPDPCGVEVSLGKAVKKWSDDAADGYELDVTKLPAGVKIVRFYNSW